MSGLKLRYYEHGTLLCCLIGLISLTCTGCGKSSGIEKVVFTGNVSLDGQPISNGEIRFFPIEGTEGPVSGSPIVDGTYETKYRDGIPVGKHRVEIMAYRAKGGSVPAEIAREGGATEQYLPPKYNTSSELTRSVESDTETMDFELTSK